MRVLQLKQLHGPLHVGQAARAELDVPRAVGAARDAFGLHARLDAADLADGRRADPVQRVAELGDHPGEPRAEVLVAGGGLGAQERLRLPRRGPAPVVGPVGGQGADQGSLAALRPQVGVHDQGRVGHGQHEQPPELRRHRVGRVRGLLLRPAGQRVVHEQHVGVAAVAALVPAEPAHRDHREPGRQRAAQLGGDLAQRHRQRRLQRSLSDAGQRLPRRGERRSSPAGDAEHVGGGGTKELAAAHRTNRGHRGLGVVLVPLDGRHHLGPQPGQAPGVQLGVVAEDRDRLGRAQQQAGRVPGWSPSGRAAPAGARPRGPDRRGGSR